MEATTQINKSHSLLRQSKPSLLMSVDKMKYIIFYAIQADGKFFGRGEAILRPEVYLLPSNPKLYSFIKPIICYFCFGCGSPGGMCDYSGFNICINGS